MSLVLIALGGDWVADIVICCMVIQVRLIHCTDEKSVVVSPCKCSSAACMCACICYKSCSKARVGRRHSLKNWSVRWLFKNTEYMKYYFNSNVVSLIINVSKKCKAWIYSIVMKVFLGFMNKMDSYVFWRSRRFVVVKEWHHYKSYFTE